MINSTEIGKPYMVNNVIGRITGYSDKGSEFDGIYSIVFLSTPHGTVIETGNIHLKELTDDQLNQLKEYEDDARNKSGVIYNGILSKL
jgi:hypothetical protein